MALTKVDCDSGAVRSTTPPSREPPRCPTATNSTPATSHTLPKPRWQAYLRFPATRHGICCSLSTRASRFYRIRFHIELTPVGRSKNGLDQSHDAAAKNAKTFSMTDLKRQSRNIGIVWLISISQPLTRGLTLSTTRKFSSRSSRTYLGPSSFHCLSAQLLSNPRP